MSLSIFEWIEQYTDFLSLTSHNTVLCGICRCTFKCSQRFQILNHLQTQKHLSNIDRCSEAIPSTSDTNSKFVQELCQAFMAANIPWAKLNNSVFRCFLEKHFKRQVPDESTIRRQLPTIYKNTIATISKEIVDKNIWLSVDETMDDTGRKVTNLIVGNLTVSLMSKPWLVSSTVVHHTTSEVISSTVRNNIQTLLPNVKPENILLLVTDPAAYMLQAGKLLKEVFPNMLHLTCLAHTLHQICEFVREEYENVDDLVSECEKIFLKAPSCITIYKEQCPDLPLPPTPVITRWGTWIEAVTFYAENYVTLRGAVNALENTTKSVERCKKLFSEPLLFEQLGFIKNNFGHLPPAIKLLECRYQRLPESLGIFNNAIDKLKVTGDFGSRLVQYVDRLKDDNPDFYKINKIAQNIKNNKANVYEKNFIYAPVASADVERYFSNLKKILSNKQRCFNPKNLEQYIVVSCNSQEK